MKSYFKIIIIIAAVILMILMLGLVRKIVILNKCAKEIEEVNYYMKETTYSQDKVSIIEKYYKDGNSLVKVKDDDGEYNFYRIDDEVKLTVERDGTSKIITEKAQIPNIDISPNSKVLVTPNIGTALGVKISTEKCNGKECYLVESYNGVRVWVEKETGLMVRAMNMISYNENKEHNAIVDYIYEFNNVDDSKLVMP